jgi:hypothetical protein
MKEPDYVMRMMVTGGPLRDNETCEGLKCVIGSDTNARLTGIFSTGTPLMITTTFGMGCHLDRGQLDHTQVGDMCVFFFVGTH